jgi:hypothetical protein
MREVKKMFRLLKNKKAQNTIEYALIIAVVIGAFTAMQLYNRRALNMRVKQGMDRLPLAVVAKEDGGVAGETPLINSGGESIFGTKDDKQYEPYYYAAGTYDMTVTSTEGRDEAHFGQTEGNRTMTGQSVQRVGQQEVTGTEKEY